MKKSLTGLALLTLLSCETPTYPVPEESDIKTDTVYVNADTTYINPQDNSFTLNISAITYEDYVSWGLTTFGKVFNECYNDIQLRPNLRLYKGSENLENNVWLSDTYGHLGGEPDYNSSILSDSTDTLPAFGSLYHLTFSDTLDWDESDIYYRFKFKQNSLSKSMNKTIEGKVNTETRKNIQ